MHACAINLGRRPTFYEHADHSLLEAHLLDFEGDLYGEPARVRFTDFLRSERKFDGIDALVAQLRTRHRTRPPAARRLTGDPGSMGTLTWVSGGSRDRRCADAEAVWSCAASCETEAAPGWIDGSADMAMASIAPWSAAIGAVRPSSDVGWWRRGPMRAGHAAWLGSSPP